MRKLIVAILAMAAMAAAHPSKAEIVTRIAVTVAATDITNLDRTSAYRVFFDTPAEFETDASVIANVDLCESTRFLRRVGEYTCRKQVRFVVAKSMADADIVISDHAGYDGDAISVCTGGDFGDCDVVIANRKVTVDRESLKEKGFIPDPTLE